MSLRKTRCSVTGSVWELHVIVLVTGDKTFLSRSNMTILRYSDPFVNQWKNCKNFLHMLVYQQRLVDSLYEGQLCYSRANPLLVVNILPPDHVGCPEFPQIIIAAERCVEEYSWGTTSPLCLVSTRHLKWHPDTLHKAAFSLRHHVKWIPMFLKNIFAVNFCVT